MEKMFFFCLGFLMIDVDCQEEIHDMNLKSYLKQ